LKRITLNFSNIRIGGAKQVAISFLLELSDKDIKSYNILVSREIYDELKSLNFRFLELLKIYNSSLLNLLSFSLLSEIKEAKIIFTLFGPFYAFTRAKTITGFAQPWILYSDNLIYDQMFFLQKIKFKLKFFIQTLFFKKDDLLITETEVAKDILIDKLNFKNVNVVNNSLNTIFYEHTPKFKDENLFFKIGVIGRNYPHKNLRILPQVLKNLKVQYSNEVSFHVTLTDEEFKSMSPSFQNNIINVGSLKVNECPDFYNKMDIIFFPSLLEVFSATPLESLYMKKPFICSDLPFNKVFLKDFAFYAKPNDIIDSSKVISEVIELLKRNDTFLFNKLNLGSQYVKQNFKPSIRALAYIDIINNYE
jgi:glycosyltransferase involved in cell wall biosynthesis